jgi:hypothetical protein
MKPTRFIAACLLGTLLGLSACQTPGTPRDPSAEQQPRPLFDLRRSREAEPIVALLAYYESLGEKKAPELAKEIDRLRAELPEGCGRERLQLGLAEFVRAQDTTAGLMRPCLDDEAQDPSVRRFAHLLQARLDERRAQRTALRVVQGRLDQQRQEIQELRRQLDGLKAIERSLQGRDRNSPPE